MWLLALTAMVCAFYLPQLLRGTVQFDGVDVHYTSQRYFSDALRSGHLPFWTPYVFAGFPFLADLQVGAWYPLNWPFFLAGITPASISGELLLHSLIACGGAYALAIRLIGRPAAGVAAAIFYGLSGWFAAHSQHVGMSEAAAWLPWLVLFVDVLADGLSLARLALAGLLGAALALPGHFQVALYALSGVSLWALLEAAMCRSLQHARRAAIGLATTVSWGSCVAAVMLLPALELVDQSVRRDFNARDVDLGYFHPESLLTLVQPDHYGLISGRYSGPGDITQHYFYAGILLPPLVALGIRNTLVVRTAVLLGLPFVWYAAGPAAGLFRFVVRLPGFSSVELPMHGWFLPALGLALVGGAGFAIVEQRLPRAWVAVLVAILFLDVFTVNELLNPLAFARRGFDELYGAALRSFQLQVANANEPVERVNGPPLSVIGYRNHALQSYVETTYGYNPLELARYADYAAAAESNQRLLDGLAATHRLQPDLTLRRNDSALPLAFFTRQVTQVPDETSARQRLADLDPSEETLVVAPAPSAQLDASAVVRVVERGEDHVVLHYRTGVASMLRVAIPWFPGWRATLDGVEVPIVIADAAFIGAPVPAGEGDLRLAYAPRFFAWGASISVVAIVATAAALVRGYVLNRRALGVAGSASRPEC